MAAVLHENQVLPELPLTNGILRTVLPSADLRL